MRRIILLWIVTKFADQVIPPSVKGSIGNQNKMITRANFRGLHSVITPTELKLTSSVWVMDVSWSLHLAPLCGGWVLTRPKTLMMIKLIVGEQTKVMLLPKSQLHSNLRGWGVQWNDYGGRCGICGDAWGDFPREHEAPLGELDTWPSILQLLKNT